MHSLFYSLFGTSRGRHGVCESAKRGCFDRESYSSIASSMLIQLPSRLAAYWRTQCVTHRHFCDHRLRRQQLSRHPTSPSSLQTTMNVRGSRPSSYDYYAYSLGLVFLMIPTSHCHHDNTTLTTSTTYSFGLRRWLLLYYVQCRIDPQHRALLPYCTVGLMMGFGVVRLQCSVDVIHSVPSRHVMLTQQHDISPTPKDRAIAQC